MKYIVLLADGMSDYPLEVLNNKTPMEAAIKPHMDRLASQGVMGLAHTIPSGMPPGSDVANLAVLGYDPSLYYTGRSPIEAVSMGIKLGDSDLSLRMNLVTLSDGEDFYDKTMVDYCAGEIPTEEAALLVRDLSGFLAQGPLELYPGVSYRHCMILRDELFNPSLTPPHDITGKVIGPHLPSGDRGSFLKDLIMRSHDFLKVHPINLERQSKGLPPANCIWLWGPGNRPTLPLFKDKFSLDGCVVSAVDLVKGLGILMGMKSIDVPGVTGNIDTNYVGKADYALRGLREGCDFVYIHVEAPDECGHRGEVFNKVRSIELIDELVLGRILKNMDMDFRILVLPDHPTPLALKTHTPDPVPFFIYDSVIHKSQKPLSIFSESNGKTGIPVDPGYLLMDMFIKGRF